MESEIWGNPSYPHLANVVAEVGGIPADEALVGAGGAAGVLHDLAVVQMRYK